MPQNHPNSPAIPNHIRLVMKEDRSENKKLFNINLSELHGLNNVKEDEHAIKRMMDVADLNKDRHLSSKEFAMLVLAICKASPTFFETRLQPEYSTTITGMGDISGHAVTMDTPKLVENKNEFSVAEAAAYFAAETARKENLPPITMEDVRAQYAGGIAVTSRYLPAR